MDQLSDQVVVITGSSRGLGYAMAVEFQNAGARVVVSSRDAASVARAVASLPHPDNALGRACDVNDLAQVRALADAAIEKFGPIAVWINNAGLSHPYGKLASIDAAQWRASLETNLFGAANGCRVALEKMLPRKTGQIINVVGAGATKPAPNQSAYGISKTAILRLTQTLAQEYADSGIVIKAFQPGMIWTEMLTNAQGVDEPKLRKQFEWAMRVFGNPPEVPARKALALAQAEDGNGKMFSVLSPAMFVPRMIGELFGASKNNPRPWER